MLLNKFYEIPLGDVVMFKCTPFERTGGCFIMVLK